MNYNQLSLTTINSHQLKLTLIHYNKLSLTTINSHKLQSNLVNYNQLSPTLTSSHHLSSSLLITINFYRPLSSLPIPFNSLQLESSFINILQPSSRLTISWFLRASLTRVVIVHLWHATLIFHLDASELNFTEMEVQLIQLICEKSMLSYLKRSRDASQNFPHWP